MKKLKLQPAYWIYTKKPIKEPIHELSVEACRVAFDCPVHGFLEHCLVSSAKVNVANEPSLFYAFCEHCNKQYPIKLKIKLVLETCADQETIPPAAS